MRRSHKKLRALVGTHIPVGSLMPWRFATHKLLLASIAVVAVGRAPVALLAQTRPTSDSVRGTVFVIGTVHAPRGLLLDSAYSAGHIRAALERFNPTVVGVEATPLDHAWGRYRYATWEIEHVVLPWTQDRQVPVYGIDWQDLDESGIRRNLARLRSADTASAPSLATWEQDATAVARIINQSLTGDFADPEHTHWHEWFVWINSGARNNAPALRQWWEQANDDTDQGRMVRSLSMRDDRIIDQIFALLRQNPGARVAILIGHGHKPDLDRKLSRIDGLQVVQLSDFPPINLSEARQRALPQDALRILREALDGNAYYFNPAGVDLALVRRQLDALRRLQSASDLARYYEARLRVTEGRLPEAASLLKAILDRQGPAESLPIGPWPPALSVRQIALLELGKVFDLRGDRDSALASYRRVAADLDSIRQPVPDDSIFVNRTDWLTRAPLLIARLGGQQTLREIVATLLREPWALSGAPPPK